MLAKISYFKGPIIFPFKKLNCVKPQYNNDQRHLINMAGVISNTETPKDFNRKGDYLVVIRIGKIYFLDLAILFKKR